MDAISELKTEIDLKKQEHADILSNLSQALQSKDDAEQKLQSIKEIIKEDTEAFKLLAGLPNPKKERLIGFGSGILASIIASVLYGISLYIGTKLGWITK